MQAVPLSKCFVDSEVEAAALRALRSGNYILGKECEAFEAEVAAHTGTQHFVLGSSWTMIVFLLHQLQELGPGDEVIVPSHTAFPSIEPLLQLGARPVFVDVDESYVMDPEQVGAAVTPRTVGLLPRARPSAVWVISARSASSRLRISRFWATAGASLPVMPKRPPVFACCATTDVKGSTSMIFPATT